MDAAPQEPNELISNARNDCFCNVFLPKASVCVTLVFPMLSITLLEGYGVGEGKVVLCE